MSIEAHAFSSQGYLGGGSRRRLHHSHGMPIHPTGNERSDWC